MVLEERLALLKKLVNQQNKYNKKEIKLNAETKILNEQIMKPQEPIVKDLVPVNETSKEQVDNQEVNEEIPIDYEEYETVEYKPLILNDTNVNTHFLTPTITPCFKIEKINNLNYMIIVINRYEFLLFIKEEISYIFNKTLNQTNVFTSDLDNLIRGFGSTDISTIAAYLQMIDLIKASKKSKYIKSLQNYLNENFYQTNRGYVVEEGDGLNNVDLFIELRKLLAAKKSGHNNVDNDIKKISQKLLDNKLIDKNKFDKFNN